MIVWVYDKWGNQIGNLKDFMGFVHDDELGALDFIEFTLVGEHVSKDDYLVWRDEFGVWHEHIVKSVTVNHSDGMVLQDVYALNSVCELTKSYIDERDAYNTTNVVAFTRALDGTRWQNGSISSLGDNSIKFYHTSVYDGIVNIINKWGGEISTSITVSSAGVSSREINHKKTIGEDNGLLFTYGFDMSNIERKVELDNVYTRLYVFGKGEPNFGDDGDITGYGRRINFADINGGKEYVEDNTAMQKWGVMGKNNVRKHSEGVAIFEECEDKNELLELGKAKLEEVKQPRITYTTNVSILADAGMQFKNARRGDVCYIRDKVLDERLNGRILHVRRFLNSTKPTEITIGNLKRTVADVFKEQQKQIGKLQDQSVNWEGASNYNREWLDQMMNHLNQVMNDSGGYAYWEEGEGITVYDRPKDKNPTMAIQLKGAGFRIANSKKSNGEWDWRTFGTGDGFTADVINVGTLKCGDNRIDLDSGTVTFRNGIIQDLKSLNYINLGTGECRLAAAATVGGKTVPEIAQETVDAEVNNFVSKVYDPKIADLQKQIDGQIETWYYDYEPKLTNKPASDWNTEDKKKAHEGDLFYWKSKGYAYRFFKDGTTWKWDMVQDTDITRALAGAAAAQDTADAKRRVFVSQPTPPYDIGDLWVQGSNGDILRCKMARSSGSYVSTDWIKASKYTDDSALTAFISGEFSDTIKDLEAQDDKKAETWYQANDPSSSWTNATLKNEHIGDLWFNSSTGVAKRWSGSAWVEMTTNPPKEVFDEIDGKAQIFISQPKPPYSVGDLWFKDSSSDIMTCITSRSSGSYTSSDWAKRNKYIDQSAANTAASNAVNAQTQESIFNKLTNNKQNQGIYLSGGNLYLNASMINTGSLSANRITTGTLSDSDGNFSLNLSTGALTAKKLTIDSTYLKLNSDGFLESVYSGVGACLFAYGRLYFFAADYQNQNNRGSLMSSIASVGGNISLAASGITVATPPDRIGNAYGNSSASGVGSFSNAIYVKTYYKTGQNSNSESSYTFAMGYRVIYGLIVL